MEVVMGYKCLSCGAALQFDPPSQKWKCDHCLSTFEKEELDHDVYGASQLDENQGELEVYKCNNCGGELITDPTVSATFCLFCASPTIIKTRFSGKFKPKSVIPFKLTKQQALQIYRDWIKKHRFAPTAYKEEKTVEKLTGIYAPFWLFDTKVDGSIQGEGTIRRSWTAGGYNYTLTKYYDVFRRGSTSYTDIPIDASTKLDDELMRLIEPYDYKEMIDFSMQYMSGFMAEKYDVESDEAAPIMRSRVEGYMAQSLNSTIQNYSSFQGSQPQITLSENNSDYCLLPIYLLVNKFEGKEYIFMINGQTGKVVGSAPISFKKQSLFAASVFGILWIISVFGGALFG